MRWRKTKGVERKKAEGLHPFFELKLNRIAIPKDREPDCDPELVSAMAESVNSGVGLLHPICVRDVNGRFELVSGLVRLEVCRQLGHKTIWCKRFRGDENETKLARLAEDLWRKQLTVLQRSVALSEYYHLASAQFTVSGQPVQKRGRPYGGASLAARQVPAIGRSVEARRKILSRSFRIANNIPPEVQSEVVNAGLDDNQEVLLKLANAGTVKAQLKCIEKLRANKVLGSVQADAGERDDLSAQAAPQRRARGSSDPGAGKETTLLDLEERFCTKASTLVWAYAPPDIREAFVRIALRKRCKATRAVTEFLDETFCGHESIPATALKQLARGKGLSWKVVRENLKFKRFRRKRKGHGAGAQVFYYNPDVEWKDQIPLVSSEAISAARADAKTQTVSLKKGGSQDSSMRDDSSDPYYST